MDRYRGSSKFYKTKLNRPEKEPTKLHLVCGNCELLHLIPNLDSDYFCSCGNQMIEHLNNRTNIKAKEIQFKQ